MTAIAIPKLNVSATRPANPLDQASIDVLSYLGAELGSDRAYVFHFRGADMPNTHEWVRDGTTSFIDHLAHTHIDDLPYFANELLRGREVVVDAPSHLPPEGHKEAAELAREDIASLAMVPIPALGLDSSKTISGFIGVDFCSGRRQQRPSEGGDVEDNDQEAKEQEARANLKTQQVLSRLRDAGRFLFGVQSLLELCTGVSPVPNERIRSAKSLLVPPTQAYRIKYLSELFPRVAHHPLFQRVAQSIGKFLPAAVASPLKKPLALAHSAKLWTEAQRGASKAFAERRYAHLAPETYFSDGFGPAEFEDFRSEVLRMVDRFPPDIAPYSRFRSVGYARYRYRNGTILPLKSKDFFQIDPTANVLLNAKPRPFAKLEDSVRTHPVLMHMLRVLLERVWNGDLGPDAHLNVHPVHVRNFHDGEIHNQCHATLEGTHVDSTMRVAVVLFRRQNVKDGTAKTSIYHKSTKIGLRRDDPEDEKILAPKRIKEVLLQQPFESITFDDPNFKHDASDPVPADVTEKMSRVVLLIMCRVPCALPSPIDGRPIDGFTPRSPRPTTMALESRI